MVETYGGAIEVEIRPRGPTTVVRLRGSLTEATRAGVKARFEEALSAGPARMVVSMAGVEYVSSAGLGLFLSVLKRARILGCEMVLAALTPGIQELFAITRLTKVFPLHATEEEACAEVRA